MRCGRAEEFESYVDDPTTLEAVQALHDPPEVVVEVVQGAKETGTIACGHSPACIILLPVVIEDLAFPVHFRNASVKTGEKLSYEAVFRHNGQFVRATARDAEVVREIQFLALQALDRNVVVEVARAPLDATGKAGKFERTGVQSQVDLLTPYTKLLGNPTAPNRARALSEATRVLGDDALPLVRARLTDAKEPAEVKSEFFRTMCYPGSPPFAKPGRARELMYAFAAAEPPASAALAALECCERGSAPQNAALKLTLSEATPLVEATLRALGEVPTTREFLDQSAALHLWAGNPTRGEPAVANSPHAAIVSALEACRPAVRRSYLAFLFGAPLSEDDLRALVVNPEFAVQVHMRLTPNHDADYALLLHALAHVDPRQAGGALMTLQSRTTVPTPVERKLLVELYTKELDARARAALLARLVASSAVEQGEAAAVLRERLAPSAEASGKAPATRASEGYLSERPSDRDVERHAALAALGSAADELPLLRYAARYDLCQTKITGTADGASGSERARSCGFEPLRALSKPDEVFVLPDLARYALGLRGCSTLDPKVIEQALAAKGPARVCASAATTSASGK